MSNLQDFNKAFLTQVIAYEPMDKHTSLGVGGSAMSFFTAINQKHLKEAVAHAITQKLNFLVIGDGCNLLVSDNTVDYLVIKNEVKNIAVSGNLLSVCSGTKLQNLVDLTIQKGLSGMNKLTGIPGTVGGAIYGNAGAYGQTISDYLQEVTCFNGHNSLILNKKQCKFSYRDSGFKRNRLIILEASFKLPNGNSQNLAEESHKILAQRAAKYPPNTKSAGSFFKNILTKDLPKNVLSLIPEEKIVYGKISSGFLLEQVGAKGQKIGGIKIADYHANLFINLGNGKASDFYKLASVYAKKVKDRFGITLEPEVQLIGLPRLKV